MGVARARREALNAYQEAMSYAPNNQVGFGWWFVMTVYEKTVVLLAWGGAGGRAGGWGGAGGACSACARARAPQPSRCSMPHAANAR